MTPIVIIPARLRSARLPGKPLATIAGRPMILHVVDRALAAGIGPVFVATEDAAIADVVRAAGARAVLTREHPSGSDRVAEAIGAADPARAHDVVVNLQGDEPEIDPAAVRALLTPLADPAVAVATLAAPLPLDERANTNAVKLIGRVCGPDRVEALAFRRSLPADADWQGVLRHIGAYAFRRAALERFVSLPPSANEQTERLEQLRALDAGMRIDAALVGSAHRGVDTPADLAAVRARMAGGGTR